MAARKNRGTETLPDDWKNKIKATAILNRLNECVEGRVELTAQQIKAADIILKKIVSDLARTELTGKDGEAIKVESSDVTQKVLAALPQDKLESLLSEKPQDNA